MDEAPTADPAISPTGRLFMRLQATATIAPATQLVAAVEPCVSACSIRPSCSIAPVRASPSTITKSPATSGNTLQEMCFRRSQGARR